MLRRTVLFVLLLFLATGGGALAASAAKAVPAQPADDGTLTATVSFPPGDVAAGRLAFRANKCFVCHAVAGPEGVDLKTRTPVPAPLLDSHLAKMNPGELITALIAPSHKVSRPVAEAAGGKLSPMGDFSSSLTLRNVADLVAFLRSIDETKK